MYYRVENRVDATVGNICGQIKFHNVEDSYKIHNDFVDIPVLKAKLERRAKITDVLSDNTIVATGITVNKKVREIFDNHHLMEHKYYPIEVEAKGNLLYYDFLHVYDEKNINNYIDFNKSSFVRSGLTIERSPITLKSYEDYLSKKGEYGVCNGIKIVEIVLTDKFDKNLDMFTFSPLGGGLHLYISERLKNALEANNVSGIEYHPVSRIRFQEEVSANVDD